MNTKKTAAELKKKAAEYAEKSQQLLNKAEQIEQQEELDILRKVKKAGLLDTLKIMLADSVKSNATNAKSQSDKSVSQSEELELLMQAPLQELK